MERQMRIAQPVELDTTALDARLLALNRAVHQSAISRLVGETNADPKSFVWPADSRVRRCQAR
jgi:hypothetical protein